MITCRPGAQKTLLTLLHAVLNAPAGNHPMFPVFDENGCADACARTPGCDAWTYCGRKEGCGSGCAAYVAKNPQRESSMHVLTECPVSQLPVCVQTWPMASGIIPQCGHHQRRQPLLHNQSTAVA